MARLATEARTVYQRIKDQRRGLDFDDLLVRTRDLLRGDPDRSRGFDCDAYRDRVRPGR